MLRKRSALATRLGPLQAHLQGVSALRPDPAVRSLFALGGREPPPVEGPVDVYAPPAFLDTLENAGQRVPISGSIGRDGDECYVDGTVIIESIGFAQVPYLPSPARPTCARTRPRTVRRWRPARTTSARA